MSDSGSTGSIAPVGGPPATLSSRLDPRRERRKQRRYRSDDQDTEERNASDGDSVGEQDLKRRRRKGRYLDVRC